MRKTTLIMAIIFAIGIIAPAFAEDDAAGTVTNKQALLEKYKNAQAQYTAAKQQYLAAKQNYTDAKDNWESAKKAYLEKKNNTNATTAMLEKGKTYLTRTVDNRIKHFELVRSKVENMSVLTDAEKISIITEINASIATFEAFKPEIASVETKEGLKAIASKIKDAWTTSQRGVERAAGYVLAAKEAKLIELAEKVSEQANTRIEKLKAAGKDTSSYEATLSEFNAKLEAAKQDIDSAKEKFEAAGSAQTASEKKTLIKEGRELLKNAHEKIKEAHKIIKEGLKNATKKAKEAKKDLKENKSLSPADTE